MISIKVIYIFVMELIQELLLFYYLELEFLLTLFSLLNRALRSKLIIIVWSNEHLKPESTLSLFTLASNKHGIGGLVFLCFNEKVNFTLLPGWK